jgi:hypothetical protein
MALPVYWTISVLTDNVMKKHWPKENNINKDVKSVMDNIIGSQLNNDLCEYYDGWEHGKNEESRWFFTKVPDHLKNRIMLEYQKDTYPYLIIRSSQSNE